MSWHECSRCGAKVGPAEGKYHECYEHNQYFKEQHERDTKKLFDRRDSGGKRVQR